MTYRVWEVERSGEVCSGRFSDRKESGKSGDYLHCTWIRTQNPQVSDSRYDPKKGNVGCLCCKAKAVSCDNLQWAVLASNCSERRAGAFRRVSQGSMSVGRVFPGSMSVGWVSPGSVSVGRECWGPLSPWSLSCKSQHHTPGLSQVSGCIWVVIYMQVILNHIGNIQIQLQRTSEVHLKFHTLGLEASITLSDNLTR